MKPRAPTLGAPQQIALLSSAWQPTTDHSKRSGTALPDARRGPRTSPAVRFTECREPMEIQASRSVTPLSLEISGDIDLAGPQPP
jgi:hypothetical protein